MTTNWFPIILIIALLGLLVVLATLQYSWLGQISDSEQIRLEKRLKEDTKRFADDFNEEINLIYNDFQLDAQIYETGNWRAFNKRYAYWKTRTINPELIKGIYFFSNGNPQQLLEFRAEKGEFLTASGSPQVSAIVKELGSQRVFSPILKNETALAIAVYEQDEHIEKIVTQTRERNSTLLKTSEQFKLPGKYGHLLIVLNEEFIAKNLLPSLTEKYFSDPDGGKYKVSIANESGKKVFKTHDEEISSMDSTAKMFNLTSNNFVFLPKDAKSWVERDSSSRKNLIIRNSRSVSTEVSERETTTTDNVVSVNVQRIGIEKPKIAIFEGKEISQKGIWTLKVQHTSGSLGQFILDTRRKNLAISFGILGLLAASMILIFLSSQRAKLLAQRQMDFVSSVSHEFRTPLSVIYSAGENLSDGVIGEKEKISTYGNLIKREGKKLSGMVEQILEFAGARSGNRKYDLKEIKLEHVLQRALEECDSVIKENEFKVEKNLAIDLKTVLADENALNQAIQNLINNALKYSNGKKWIKISARNFESGVRMEIEDGGIGISEKDKAQIFEPFFRSETVVDEQISGNGLGLSLVKQIIEGHGGKIAVESELGSGSNFSIYLPASV